MQKNAVASLIFQLESRARAGRSHADYMIKLLDKVHGTELIKEVKKEKAPAILIGEKRQGDSLVLTCTRVDGGRIYWSNEKGFKSWTGAASWRKFPLIANP
jgi:hypothetical protein